MGEIDEDTLCASDDAMTRGAGSRRGLYTMTNIPVSAPALAQGWSALSVSPNSVTCEGTRETKIYGTVLIAAFMPLL
jgi:hypothetical protein